MLNISPTFHVPSGACDCHMHFYCGPGQSDAPFPVPKADVEAYRVVMRRLGLSRVVAVQSLVYGTDNTCILKAIDKIGHNARGIAVISLDVEDEMLYFLTDRGIMGARAFMLFNNLYNWADIPELARRIAPFGWHLQIQINGRDLDSYEDILQHLACPVVIDHVGKFFPPVDPAHPSFIALRRLVANGKCWVKLSGFYETSQTGPPDYTDVVRLARILTEDASERMLWGSNWPHPNQQCPAPDDLELLRILEDIAPKHQVRKQILVDNPATLFSFTREEKETSYESL